MQGYITPCFSDWNATTFQRGVMQIQNGTRTDRAIRRPLKEKEETEGVDYYIKPDPDFDNYTYSRCHRGLRKSIDKGDLLFFRTLWRGKHYLIGYFLIKGKMGDYNDPICIASEEDSPLIDFSLPISPALVKKINSRAKFTSARPLNRQMNEFLGRNYLKLSSDGLKLLRTLIEKEVNK